MYAKGLLSLLSALFFFIVTFTCTATAQKSDQDGKATEKNEEKVLKSRPPSPAQSGKQKMGEKKENYWFNKGALVSTYGNEDAAVRYFNQSLKIDPEQAKSFFQKGVSYGEKGNYKQAVLSITKALKMEPKNGMYYYGRGRVYMQAGDKGRAIKDFLRASKLDYGDAAQYIRRILN